MAIINIKGINKTFELKIGHFYEVRYRRAYQDRQSETANPEILMYLCQNEGYTVTAGDPPLKGLRFINWLSGDADINEFWRPILIEDIIDIVEVAAPGPLTVNMASTFNTTGNKGKLTDGNTHLLTFDNLYVAPAV